MTPPKLLPTTAKGETFAGVTYHLEGELVPVLTVDITPSTGIFFEHYILLWKHTTVEIGVKSLKGAFKRLLAGMQVLVTEASGSGQIAMSRDGAGQIIALHLKPSDEIHVREHQFLAATNAVNYTFERVQGIANLMFSGSGFFIDKFQSPQSDGILWLHGYGNVFEKVLEPGEQIDVEPGAWLYKDSTVKLETKVAKLSTGLLGGMNLVLNRFTGPGRLGIQSMALVMSTES